MATLGMMCHVIIAITLLVLQVWCNIHFYHIYNCDVKFLDERSVLLIPSYVVFTACCICHNELILCTPTLITVYLARVNPYGRFCEINITLVNFMNQYCNNYHKQVIYQLPTLIYIDYLTTNQKASRVSS